VWCRFKPLIRFAIRDGSTSSPLSGLRLIAFFADSFDKRRRLRALVLHRGATRRRSTRTSRTPGTRLQRFADVPHASLAHHAFDFKFSCLHFHPFFVTPTPAVVFVASLVPPATVIRNGAVTTAFAMSNCSHTL
jgi:hypothetical protein